MTPQPDAAAQGQVWPLLVEELARNGLLGVIVLALAWVAWRLIQREVTRADEAIAREAARADRAEAALAELHREMRATVVPALVESRSAAQAATEAVKDIASSAIRGHG
jgi:hypothetical protein